GVAGAARAAVEVSLLGGALALRAPRGARRLADPRGQRSEDRVEALPPRRLAADHETEAALEPPDPAARAHVHVVEAARAELVGAPDVVVVVRVAAVDDHVVALEQRHEARA